MLVLEVFLSVLFVMSGIDLLLRKFVSMLFLISVLEEDAVDVKLKQGTVVALKYNLINILKMKISWISPDTGI